MNNAPAISVLKRLQADPGIQGWIENKLPDAEINWRYGLNLEPNAQDYPYVAVAAPQGQGGPQMTGMGQTIVVQVGVFSDEETEQEGYKAARGLVLVCDLLDLIKLALHSQPIDNVFNATWDYSFNEATDAGTEHPFYRGELHIPLTLHFDELVD